MSNNKRVVKFRKHRSLNIGIVIFSILFLYIAINVYLYFTKEHISIFEVQEGSNVEDNLVMGLILREEKIINSESAGFVSYFQKEGSRVAKNTSVYSVDESTQILDVITNGDAPLKLSKENNAQFKHEIDKFHASFSDHDFSAVYSFKENAQNTAIDLINLTMLEKGQKIQEETGFSYTYQVVPSMESGIITYYMDSFEDVTEETVSAEMFQPQDYQRISLRTTERIERNAPVYKLITSENWSIMLRLSKDQYEKLIGKEQIKFTIQKDGFEITAPLSLLPPKGTDYYAKLSMDEHMTNYLQDRQLEIMLHMDEIKGLKIPLTSIVEKDFYLVPLEYFTTGGDSGNDGLVKESYSENGEVKLNFIQADKYYQDDKYGYVDTRLFSPGTWIQSVNGADRYQLSLTGKLTGVFNVNMGYAVFKRIEIIYQNKEYSIVKKNTSYGLALYDHIALDATTAVEQKIIY